MPLLHHFFSLEQQKNPRSHGGLLAERGGFEPPRRSYRPTGIRSQTLQPLGYLSISNCISNRDYTIITYIRANRFAACPGYHLTDIYASSIFSTLIAFSSISTSMPRVLNSSPSATNLISPLLGSTLTFFALV